MEVFLKYSRWEFVSLPRIIPMPKKVSRMANIVATLSGNSLAIILKDPVKNPAFPQASMIL